EDAPNGGHDVHVTTPEGTVHAYGCQRVEIDPRTRLPAPPQQPCASPYPYPYYMPYPVYVMPTAPAYYYPVRQKPRYAPDPARTGAIVASSLLFGIGTAAAGLAYVAEKSHEDGAYWDHHGDKMGERAAVVALGAAVTIPASLPRYVVGDVGIGLLFTGLRAGSFALGAIPNWKDNYAMPVTFAFAVPVALSIIDIATTPHREQLMRKRAAADAKKSFILDGVAPTVARDERGTMMPGLGASGRF
ncbi:MAG TPA: hypothetical protein VHB21_21490, partial [Minicystis sp.]|nr:hypothetical protein [Minicystis sp.]